AEVDGALRVAVERGVKEGTVRAGGPGHARQRAVEDVARAGEDQHYSGRAQLAERGEPGGEKRQGGPDDRDLVRGERRAPERRDQGLGVAADPCLKPRGEHPTPPVLSPARR